MRTPTRLLLLMVGLLLLLVLQPAQAASAATSVSLLPEHVGASNPGFEIDKPDCGADPQAAFMWRFALVWLDPSTPPGVLTARFAKSGVITNSSPVMFGGGNMQKFWVYTDVADTLLEASVSLPSLKAGSQSPALKLSGVNHGCTPTPPAAASVKLGACVFGTGPKSPAAITVTPPGGATVVVRDATGKVVATTSRTTTLHVAPGIFRWTAVAAEGRTLQGPAGGVLSAGTCRGRGPVVLPEQLPRTGAPLGALTAGGLAFLGLGSLMVASERRKPSLARPRGWWRPTTAGMSGALEWILRTCVGRIIAVSRGGVWVTRIA